MNNLMVAQEKIPLSIVIVARNEEARLDSCLQSCQFASEIILIDDNSEDKTVEIALSYGAKVFHRSLDGDWGKQQTFAIKKATQPWLFLLDCDEQISPRLKKEISLIVDKNEKFGFKVQRENHFKHFKASHGTLRPDWVLRLMPNEGVYVEGQVHQRIICPFPIKKIYGHLLHFPYSNLDQYYSKLNKYAKLSAEKYLSQKKKSSFLFDIVLRPIWAAFKVYFINLGFLDGKMGFIFAANHYSYTLQKYIRFWIKEHIHEDEL